MRDQWLERICRLPETTLPAAIFLGKLPLFLHL
jgi:hypothetical protein